MGYVKAILMSYKDSEGKQQVVVEYRHPGNPPRLRFPTNFKVLAKEWNKELGISKNDESLNSFLKAEADKLEKVKKSLMDKGIEPTCSEFEKSFNLEKEQAKKVKKSNDDKEGILNKKMSDWFNIHLQTLDNKDTRRAQNNSFNHFRSYDSTATLNDLDYHFFTDFVEYCEEQGYKNNTIHRDLKAIGFVLNTIRIHCRNHKDIKLMIQDIIQDKKDVKIKEKYAEPVALDIPQFLHLLKFERFNSKQSHLRHTLQNFVIGLSIGGLRVEDYLSISHEDVWKEKILIDGEIKEVWLCSYKESKTGKQHNSIPILSYAYPFLEQHGGLPPRVCSAVFNRQLKELAEHLGWTHTISINEFDINGKLKQVHKERFCDIFSSKFMRKTRVTIDDTIGIEESISRLATGHDSKARQRYEAKTVYSMLKENEKHDRINQKLINNEG